MLEKPKPFGFALGLLGNVIIGIAMYRLLTAVGCTADLDTLGQCTDDIQGAVPLLPVGIVLSTFAVFAGGRGFAFLGTFLAIGIGALAASFNAHDDFIPSFGKLFGGGFIAVSLLLIALWLFGAGWGRRRVAEAQHLIATGARGTGTIVNVVDTGVWVNDNPRVHVTVNIQPEDGSAPFTAEKKMVVSRFALPQVGTRMPVWYDRNDPTEWVSGDSAQYEVQSVLGNAMATPPVPMTAPAMPTAAAPAATDTVSELEKLSDLRTQGVLSEAEFESAKARVLGGSPSS
jgi:hypothetical protein